MSILFYLFFDSIMITSRPALICFLQNASIGDGKLKCYIFIVAQSSDCRVSGLTILNPRLNLVMKQMN